MHPRIRELLDHLDTQHVDFRAAIDSVPPELRERRPMPESWSVAEIVEHVARVEERIAARLRQMLDDARTRDVGPETTEGPALDGRLHATLVDRSYQLSAPEAVAPTGTVAAESAWAQFEHARGALRDVVRSGDGLALGAVSMPHARFGPLSWYEWVAFVAGHEARHAAQIRGVADQLIGEH